MSSLSQRQERALAILLSGASCQEAAATAGVRPETISRWKRSPDFAAALADGQAQLAAASRIDVAELQAKACTRIGEALDDENAGIRMRAAGLIVGRNGPLSADSATAAVMPELTLEDAICHLLAAPRTLARAIACGLIPDTEEIRTALNDGAEQLTALATAPPTVRDLSSGGPGVYLLGPGLASI